MHEAVSVRLWFSNSVFPLFTASCLYIVGGSLDLYRRRARNDENIDDAMYVAALVLVYRTDFDLGLRFKLAPVVHPISD